MPVISPHPDSFAGFLQELVDARYLEGSANGITKQVIHQGCESLTGAQEAVFQREVIDPYVRKKCDCCGNTIPWPEMFQAIRTSRCLACIIRD